ncbi:MAG: hypothetical protein RIQ37_679 [Actinomycetota bacterium]
MLLKYKVAIATAGVTALAGSSVGLASVFINHQSGIALLEEQLDQIVAEVQSNETDPLSEALFLSSTLEISLGFVELDGTVTPLQESAGDLASPGLITKELDLGSEQKLIFAVSANRVNQASADAALPIVILSILAAVLAGTISILVMRRDLVLVQKLADEAKKIAEGSTSPLNVQGGSEELISLSKALNAMVDQLQGSNQKMQDFLSDASHELRTPLTVIRGYLELLQSPSLDPEQVKKYSERSLSEALRMQSLIDDILLLAQLGEESEIDKELFDVSEIVSALVDDLKTLQPDRPVIFENSLSREFLGSQKLLSQFFSNAFANIRNHTLPNAKVLVSLSSDENEFVFDIHDAGQGIQGLEENQEFTAFKRFDKSRSRKSGGYGLGMSIMARIIQSHKGQMILTRSELGGLRVTARIPF